MSLAQLAKITTQAAQSANVLIFDVERIKGTVVHEFWDLSEMKGRRFHHNEVTEWPRVICASARWYDKPDRPEFAAEWDGGREAMLAKMWGWFNTADIVVGHNSRRFDVKHMRGEWAAQGLTRPHPWQDVDTLAVARSEFAYESNTLDALCKRFGISGKDGHYDHAVAKAALAGNRTAQRQLKGYNHGDTQATLELYDYLRPWMKNHPHLGVFTGEEASCPNCGSDNLHAAPDVPTLQTKYAGSRCGNCGAVLRRTHMRLRVGTRAAR